MFQDPNIQLSLLNTFIWAIGALILPVLFGLGIAIMTSAMKLGSVARAVVILPYALAGTIVAIIGNIIFTSQGSLNQALSAFGLMSTDSPIQWLLHWPLNVIAAILIASWQSTGVNVVLFMVGLQTIPRETTEAAALDGADGWIRFKDVIFPQLRPTTIVVIGLTITNALRAFDVIWVLTQGGPNRIVRDARALHVPGVVPAARPGGRKRDRRHPHDHRGRLLVDLPPPPDWT